ncbi:MAG: hypothetical protein JXB05_23110 [Myxococcaceae bacterium]|nr:hypothetical protein [Myxococcaceae bacterium]
MSLFHSFRWVPLLLVSACAANPGAVRANASGSELSPPEILDVFFGLDDALPLNAVFLCPGAEGLDGIPVTFSRRVVDTYPSAKSFRITTQSNATYTPRCATVRPANDDSEHHTVLLMGQLGSQSDPPVRLDIVGSVVFEDGSDARGQSSTHVTSLTAGPSLLIGLRYAPEELSGTDCPSPATKQIVQVTWSGGVSAVGGGDLGNTQRMRMHVTVSEPDGSRRELIPFALADLGDNDNYVQLCLDDSTPAVSVRVEADTCVDPRGDPNGETSVSVSPAS